MKFLENEFVRASAILAGAAIGGGIFSIPYVFVQAGIGLSTILFLFLAAVIVLLHVMFAEVVERTPGAHRLVGYSERYFGWWGKGLITVSAVAGTMGALVAYLLLGSSFLSIFLTPFGVSSAAAAVIFWFLMAGGVIFGMRTVAKVDTVLVSLLVVALGAIILRAIPFFDPSHFLIHDTSSFLAPYGIVLFALVGFPVIPGIRATLNSHGPRYRRAIIVGTLIPIVLTYLFGLAVALVSGPDTTPDAIGGLIPHFGYGITLAGAGVGLLAISTSFFAFGLYMRDTLLFDWDLRPAVSNAITILVPAGLILAGATSIIDTLSFAGAVLGAIDGVMVVLLFREARRRGRRRPDFTFPVPFAVQLLLIAALIFGGVYSLLEIGVG